MRTATVMAPASRAIPKSQQQARLKFFSCQWWISDFLFFVLKSLSILDIRIVQNFTQRFCIFRHLQPPFFSADLFTYIFSPRKLFLCSFTYEVNIKHHVTPSSRVRSTYKRWKKERLSLIINNNHLLHAWLPAWSTRRTPSRPSPPPSPHPPRQSELCGIFIPRFLYVY